ncbi:MAG: TrkH family potassium uptake protein [Pseudobdellovibrionaceae bacterium]
MGSVIGYTLGVLSLIYGTAMFVPLAFELHAGTENARAFILAAVISLFLGGMLYFSCDQDRKNVTAREGFVLTTCSWVWMTFLSLLPLPFSSLHLSFTDAAFEAMSGLTTTGSTVITGLDSLSPGILVWRSIIQWIGGIGIVAFAIVLLPALRVGGMQLFHSESSDRSSKTIPLTVSYIYSLIVVYALLTLACMTTYALLGMSLFDAFNHALTTLSTGGFSTHDASFGAFNSQPLMLAGTIFMLAGGIPFVVFSRALFQAKFDLFRDEQVRAFIDVIILFSFGLFVSLMFVEGGLLPKHFIPVFFNVVSVVTTTGYASEDYVQWGPLAFGAFLFLTYVGGCSGSTGGGLKIFRIVILFRTISFQLKKLIYPSGVFALNYNGRHVSADTVMSIAAFFFIYLVTNLILATVLSFSGLDFITSITGAATSIANVGPGLGDMIGPTGNFVNVPNGAKWALIAGMLLGRLEILTVMVLFMPRLWRST